LHTCAHPDIYRQAAQRGGTVTWTPDNNTFPDGLASFHERSGWNITAHNRMWSSETTYAEQNGGKFRWLIEGAEAVPLEQRFWDYLMAQGKAWGLYVYECGRLGLDVDIFLTRPCTNVVANSDSDFCCDCVL